MKYRRAILNSEELSKIMNKLSKLSAIVIFSLPSLLLTNGVKAENKFDVCLRELTTSGVATSQAQIGCADALYPKDLSYCVKTITQSTEIVGIDALKNCYLVRRPIELGNCVADIQNTILSPAQMSTTTPNTNNTAQTNTQTNTGVIVEVVETDDDEAVEENSEVVEVTLTPTQASLGVLTAMNTCRASLLPARHSQCVIALSRTPEQSNPIQAMETCLSAEDFPRGLYPQNQS